MAKAGNVLLRNMGRSKWFFYLDLEPAEVEMAEEAGWEKRSSGSCRLVVGDREDHQREGWPQPEQTMPAAIWKKLLDTEDPKHGKQGQVIHGLIERAEFVHYAA